MDMAVSQQERCDLEEYDKWKLVMPRHPEVKLGDKNKKKKIKKVSQHTIE